MTVETGRTGAAIVVITLLIVTGSTVAVAGPVGANDPGTATGVSTSATNAASSTSLSTAAVVDATGYRPNETGPTDGPNVSVDWERVPGGGTTGAVVADGTAYVGAGDTLYAYDAATGDVAWQFSLSDRTGSRFEARPTVAGGQVYAVAADRYGTEEALYAVDAAEGVQRWQRAVPDGTTRPAVAGGTVYYETDASLIARSADTGFEAWSRSLPGDPTRPAVDDGRVYVGTDRPYDPGNLTALDATDGAVVWREPGDVTAVAAGDGTVYAVRPGSPDEVVARSRDGSLGWNYSNGETYDGLVADGTHVYAATTGATGVTAIDAASGSEAWRTTTEAAVAGSPVATDATLFAGTTAGRVLALDAGTGTRRWSRVSDAAVAGPAVAGGRLFVGGSRTLRVYDDAGSRLPDAGEVAGNDGYDPGATGATDGPNVSVDWERVPGEGTTGAVVANGTAYVGGGETLYAYDLTTGEIDWTFSLASRPGERFTRRPALGSGQVYAIAANRYGTEEALYAVDAATGGQTWATPVEDGVQRPVASGDAVYLANDSIVRALDPTTGALDWQFQLSSEVPGDVRSPPVVSAGRLFVGTSLDYEPGVVYAINAETGGGLWRVAGGDVRGLAAADGTVYAATDTEVVARDAATGANQWNHTGSASTYTRVAVDDSRVYAATRSATGVSALDPATGTLDWRLHTDRLSGRPTVTGDGVYVGTTTGRVHAVDRASGAVRWTRLSDAAVDGPAVADGRVLVGGSRSVRVYDDTGARLPAADENAGDDAYDPVAVGPDEGTDVSLNWSRSAPGDGATAPTTANGVAYVGQGSQLSAYDVTTGESLWNFSLSGRVGATVAARPAVAGGVVYAVAAGRYGTEEALYAVDAADGSLVWATAVEDGVQRPVASGDAVYLANDSVVRALDPATGSPEWQFRLTGDVRSPPVVSAGRLFVGTSRDYEAGTLYAINAETGGGLWKRTDGDVRGLAADGDAVYAAKDTEVVARDAADGSVEWRHDGSASTFLRASVDGERAYVVTASAPGVTALDLADGVPVWREYVADGVAGRVRVARGGAYVGVQSGSVRALNRSDGTGLWSRSVGTGATAPAVDGAHLLVANDSGEFLAYAETGRAPAASVDVSIDNPDRGEPVTFTANATDPDGTIQSYAWDLDGDGAVDAQGETVSTSYAANGTYAVTLAVTDDDGFTSRRTVEVTVGPTNPFPDGVPGVSSGMPPRNVDPGTDRAFEDVNGDGTFGFIDVVDLLFALTDLQDAPLSDAQLAAVDFDGDGSVGFLDVVTLLFEL